MSVGADFLARLVGSLDAAALPRFEAGFLVIPSLQVNVIGDGRKG